MTNQQNEILFFWFRRDLRLEDNRGLNQALSDGKSVVPVFIFDTQILDNLEDKKDKRLVFIFRALEKIDRQLRDAGSGLLVHHGKPVEIWKSLLTEFDAHAIYCNHDYEPYARRRDEAVKAIAGDMGVVFNTFKDQVIFEKSEVLTNQQQPYTVYTPYSRTWQQKLRADDLRSCDSHLKFENFRKFRPPALSSLADIGFKEVEIDVPQPEIPEKIVKSYDENRDFPAINGTTRLSVHLRFGTISPRYLVRRAMELNEVWLSELIWREFFMQILWHFPKVVDQPFKEKYAAVPWRDSREDYEKWCAGKTGYPMVDAGMRELNETGFMHNRVRMVTASFLTKHLLIDWRWGERYFAAKLLDYDLAANNGNWQWAAGCGCDAAPYFRIFNPITQLKKFDPDHKYVKHWLPELNSLDYPNPIVEHKFARQRALDAYKSAL